MDHKFEVPPQREPTAKKRWRQFWHFLYNHFGPHVEGTRRWLYLTMLFLLAIVITTLLTAIPFALLITLKAIVVVSFALCLTMGIKGVIDEYYRREGKDREYFWLPYLQDLWQEHFVLSDKRIANIIKFSIGFLLFAAVVALLVCTSGAGIAIPVVTTAVNVIAATLASAGIFAGSSWFTAIFLGVLIMVTYDAVCNIIEAIVDSCERGNKELVAKETSTQSSAASYADAGRRLIINESSQRKVINASREEAEVGVGDKIYNWFANRLTSGKKPLTREELEQLNTEEDSDEFYRDPNNFDQLQL